MYQQLETFSKNFSKKGFILTSNWTIFKYILLGGRGVRRKILKLTLKGANKFNQILISDPCECVYLIKCRINFIFKEKS